MARNSYIVVLLVIIGLVLGLLATTTGSLRYAKLSLDKPQQCTNCTIAPSQASAKLGDEGEIYCYESLQQLLDHPLPATKAYFFVAANPKYFEGTLVAIKSLLLSYNVGGARKAPTPAEPATIVVGYPESDTLLSNTTYLIAATMETLNVDVGLKFTIAYLKLAPVYPAKGHYYLHSLLKLVAWRLTSFSRIMLLDSDLVVLKPLQHIFDVEPTRPACAVGAIARHLLGGLVYSSAFMTLTPDEAAYHRMIEWYIATGRKDVYDMDVINAVIPYEDFCELKPNVMLLNVLFEVTLFPANTMLNAAYSIHYSGEKPWLGRRPQHDRLAKLYDMWWLIKECSAEDFLAAIDIFES